jgi:hypothetical protein
MEVGMGADFSAVRVHDSSQDRVDAAQLSAKAFTHGQDIWLGPNGSVSDSGLMAHEMTHVVQQSPSMTQQGPSVVDKGKIMDRDSNIAVPFSPVIPLAQDGKVLQCDREGTETRREQNILNPGEPFRWIGPDNGPILIIRKSWLIEPPRNVPAARHALSGSAYPAVLTPILNALLNRYPWAAANRSQIIGQVGDFGIDLPENWGTMTEVSVNLSRSVFLLIGLPPSAPIQLYREGAGFEIYADLRTLYGANLTEATMTNLKPAIAERIISTLERQVGRSIEPARRAAAVNIYRVAIPSQRITWRQRIYERTARLLFGDAAWDEFMGQPVAGGEGGSVFQVPGGGYQLPADVSFQDREAVENVLHELFGQAPDRGMPAEHLRLISHEEVVALVSLSSSPDRQRILDRIRRVRQIHHVTGTQSIADLIEIAREQEEIESSARSLSYHLPAPNPNVQAPIASRPVHGRILNKSGLLVPGMEAKFEFETTDRVDALRVPDVDIQWYARQQGAPQGSSSIRHERTHYIEVRDDSLFNDREFTVTFDRPGIYEIHAFVYHNFYLPAHFVIPVEVKTEHARLLDQEAESSAGFGQSGPSRRYRFRDVSEENLMVEIGLGVVTGPLVPVPLGELSREEMYGLRSTGNLSAEAFGTPGGSLGSGRRQLNQEINQLNRLIAEYQTAGSGNQDLIEWATNRRQQLRATLDQLNTLASSADNKPVAVQGNYVSRVAGVRSGPLNLISWFTFEADNQGGGTYHGHLFDHSQLVRNEDFHFQAANSNFPRMMEMLFFEITRTYPNGTMSFSFQEYDNLTPSRRFTRLERVTDTLLNDVRSVVFSETASLIVNIAATILSVFPPTAPIGIGISIAYNGANALSNFAEASRTGTIRATNYVDVGLVALDILPVLGRAARIIRVGGKAYHVINAGQHVGMAYMFTAEAFHNIEQLRGGMITDLARLRDEITLLERNNPSDPSLSTKRRDAVLLETRIRNSAVDIFSEMALNQGLTLAAQHAIGRIAEAHLGERPGQRPTATEESAIHEQPQGIERRPEEVVRGAHRVTTDPVLSHALPADLRERVIVRRGPPPNAHEVQVHYQTDSLGLITEIHIAAGPLTSFSHIEQHIPTVRLMQRYQGVSGLIRVLYERLRSLVRRNGGPFLPGSALFEASLEVEKLPRIIMERAATLQQHGLDPATRRDLEADLEHLRAELERHQSTIERGEQEIGVGFVAETVPRSNAAAIASGRPSNIPEGHYYYEPTPGVFELRAYASYTGPKKMLLHENGQWRIVDRPEGSRRDFQSFLQIQIGSFSEPLSNHPQVEAAISARYSRGDLDRGGVAIARRWGDALSALHDGGEGNTVLNRLLSHLGATASDTSYRVFRREVRKAIVDLALSQPHSQGGVDRRVTRLRELLGTLPDNRSQGETFTEFRERLAGISGSTVSYMQPLPNAEVRLPNGRFADGAIQITQGPPGTPPSGRYLVEDKSGDNAFKADQAQRYSDQLRTNGGNINTTGDPPQLYIGIVYNFDNEPAARAALPTIQSLHPNIRVSYFNPQGQLVWLR